MKARLRESRLAPSLRALRNGGRRCSRTLRLGHAADWLLLVAATLRRRRMRVSVVIPTIGRPSLQRAVESARWAYEVVVVYDAARIPDDVPPGTRAYAHGPTRHWGAEQRELGIAVSRGTHVAFMDDDDFYTEVAGQAIMRAVTARPRRVHVFRMYDGEDEYGREGWVAQGYIGSPMFVVPNDGRLGRWSTRYEGDYDFITSTLDVRGRRPRFHDEVIAVVRPSRRGASTA